MPGCLGPFFLPSNSSSKGYILTKKPWYCLVFGNFDHHNHQNYHHNHQLILIIIMIMNLGGQKKDHPAGLAEGGRGLSLTGNFFFKGCRP